MGICLELTVRRQKAPSHRIPHADVNALSVNAEAGVVVVKRPCSCSLQSTRRILDADPPAVLLRESWDHARPSPRAHVVEACSKAASLSAPPTNTSRGCPHGVTVSRNSASTSARLPPSDLVVTMTRSHDPTPPACTVRGRPNEMPYGEVPGPWRARVVQAATLLLYDLCSRSRATPARWRVVTAVHRSCSACCVPPHPSPRRWTRAR